MEAIRIRVWAFSGAVSLVLSAAAVALITLAPSLPAVAWRVAEAFAAPGEFLWWATIGGSFAGYPTGALGYLVWTLGSAVFWFVVASPFVLMANQFRYRGRR